MDRDDDAAGAPVTGSSESGSFFRGGDSWKGAALLLALVVAGVLALLDRRLMSADRKIMEQELQSLHARLERATDVLPLRMELEAKERESAAQAASVAAAMQAMKDWRGGIELEELDLTGTLPGAGIAWIAVARDGGAGYFVGQKLRDLPAGAEFVLGANVGSDERVLARFRSDASGDAIAAIAIPEPSSALTRVWLKVATAGQTPEGAPLLYFVREGA